MNIPHGLLWLLYFWLLWLLVAFYFLKLFTSISWNKMISWFIYSWFHDEIGTRVKHARNDFNRIPQSINRIPQSINRIPQSMHRILTNGTAWRPASSGGLVGKLVSFFWSSWFDETDNTEDANTNWQCLHTPCTYDAWITNTKPSKSVVLSKL